MAVRNITAIPFEFAQCISGSPAVLPSAENISPPGQELRYYRTRSYRQEQVFSFQERKSNNLGREVSFQSLIITPIPDLRKFTIRYDRDATPIST